MSWVGLDSGVLDHLAPTLLSLAEVTAELARRACDHHQPFVDAERPESLGLALQE